MEKNRMVLLFLLMPILIMSLISVKPAYAVLANIYVDPPSVVGVAPGATFSVMIMISDVNYLSSYQVTIMYKAHLLNVTGVTFGTFFAGHSNIPQYSINNDEGWVLAGQTLYGGDFVSGSGWLFTIDFLVEAYGITDLRFDVEGVFRSTFLLDSALRDIPFTVADGYFENGLAGDADGDGDVDFSDFIVLAGAYGTSSGDLGYDERADFDWDYDVDFSDFIALAGNYGKSI